MSLKKRRSRRIYWFFRSFFISEIIILCLLLFTIGCGECYARMESMITGKEIQLIEYKNNRIYILGEEIF